MQQFSPGEQPVLWPEHFDVAVTVDEVNYGVSPGEEFGEQPYSYVGPYAPRTGSFRNAPFGAVLTLEPGTTAAEVHQFFQTGRTRAAADPAR